MRYGIYFYCFYYLACVAQNYSVPQAVTQDKGVLIRDIRDSRVCSWG